MAARRRWLVGLMLLLPVVAAALLLAWLEWGNPAPLARGWLAWRTGRDVALERLELDLGRTVELRWRGLRVDNAPWGRADALLRLEQGAAQLPLGPLLRGKPVFHSLELAQGVLHLERNDEGEPNWRFGADGNGGAPAPPGVERLAARSLAFSYQDHRRADRIAGQFERLDGQLPEERPLVLEATGVLGGQSARVSLHGGSVRSMGNGRPWPLRLEARAGATRLDLEGTVSEPLSARGLDLQARLSGEDLAAIYPLFPVPAPRTPPYEVEAQVHRDGVVVRLEKLVGRLGRSDLAGALRIDFGVSPVTVSGRLRSRSLDLADLQGVVGADPQAPEPEPTRQLFPDRPLALGRLRHAAGLDLTFDAAEVRSGPFPIDDLHLRARVEPGRVRVEPLHVGTAGGAARGALILTLDGRVPDLALRLELRRWHLARLLAPLPFLDASRGLVSGDIEVAGSGRSSAEIAATLDGRVALVMEAGAIDIAAVEGLGLDLAELIVGDEPSPTPLRCTAVMFRLEEGTARTEALVIDTRDSLITGSGSIDLGREWLDLRLLAHPKDPSPLAARSPVHITGPLGGPEINVESGPIAARVLGALALGAVAGPLAAVVPFLEPGAGEDAPCQALFEQVGVSTRSQ